MIIRIILGIAMIPLMIAAFVLPAYLLPLPDFLSFNRDLFAATLAFFLVSAYLICFIIYLIYLVKKVCRVFDGIAKEFGLEIKPYSLFGRQYSGTLEMTDIVIRYFPQRSIHRAMLDIRLYFDSGTAFIISRKAPIDKGGGYVTIDNTGIMHESGHKVFASEPGRVSALLNYKNLSDTFGEMLRLRPGDLLEIYVGEEGVYIRIRASKLDKKSFVNYIRLSLAIKRIMMQCSNLTIS